jgi:hypothetical protein
MNKPDILSIARKQLCEAISDFQTPTCTPLNISPWVGMALLQKSIRRGEERLALRAAATLLSTSPERLWRRCGCIAFEDIGVADFETVAIATAALGGKRFRKSLGGEWAVANVAGRMTFCSPPKTIRLRAGAARFRLQDHRRSNRHRDRCGPLIRCSRSHLPALCARTRSLRSQTCCRTTPACSRQRRHSVRRL